MSQKFHQSSPAEQLMAIEVFAELLASTDPAMVGQKLVEQLRELTGARTIFLIAHPQNAAPCHKVLAVCPAKRAAIFSKEDLDKFCPDCCPDDLPRLTVDFTPEHVLQPILQKAGVESILRFPLMIQDRLVANILILDLPEVRRIDESVQIINYLSPVIALAIKNSLTYERTELMVARRTEELELSNEKLTQALKEKEILLQELYHRTKNTLQVIEGLLSLQAEKYEDNQGVKDLVSLTSQRIGTISLVQKMLYTSRDLSRISIRDFIMQLCQLLEKSLAVTGTSIKILLDIEDLVWLIDTMNPCGLVITELVTNSFKYAFEGRAEGEIRIRLHNDSEENTHIEYFDDGCGLPPGLEVTSLKSFGLQLIGNLVQYQLQGRIEFPQAKGFFCRITFPKPRYEKRV